MRAARAQGKVPQFPVGEFVPVAAVLPRNKLRIRRLGPYRVTGTVGEWMYSLEDGYRQVAEADSARAAHSPVRRSHFSRTGGRMRATRPRLLMLYTWMISSTGAKTTRASCNCGCVDWDLPRRRTRGSVASLHEDQPLLVERYLQRIQFE